METRDGLHAERLIKYVNQRTMKTKFLVKEKEAINMEIGNRDWTPWYQIRISGIGVNSSFSINIYTERYRKS